MINEKLINPDSIVIVGGSDDLLKPGGRILKNILDGGFSGLIYVVNPKQDLVQGIKSYHNLNDLPQSDLAVIAIQAKLCPETVEILAEKGTKAFIILSADFSESGEEGKKLEDEIISIVNKNGATLIGPNCIGVITQAYSGVFTTPVPKLHPTGCDFVSGSGATAVFIFESAIPKGLNFSSVYSVGNSAQTGVEDILEYWDKTFKPEVSSRIKLIYVESIKDPEKLLHHSSSLIRKGCHIAAIKAGTSEAGSRAASSHTGAMANSDLAVDALFRKAGIVRCFGREELVTVASVFMCKKMKGKNLAIITHAGGPAVMLTDTLSAGGINVPTISGEDEIKLLGLMNQGASASNPVDMIATATHDQLGKVIDYIEKEMNDIDGMSVIFGSNGLNNMTLVYDILHQKSLSCTKPLYTILPSVTSAASELNDYLKSGHVSFPDEVIFGNALVKVFNTPFPDDVYRMPDGIDKDRIKNIIETSADGYLSPFSSGELLSAAGIKIAKEIVVASFDDLVSDARKIGYPLAIKVVGPLHKTDSGGVTLNILTDGDLITEYNRMMAIEGATGVLLQQMLTGTELFIGAKYEPRFGHIVLCGLGGIYVEALGDISYSLAPVSAKEAEKMIKSLKGYKIIKGMRGKEGVNTEIFTDIIVRLSYLLMIAPCIMELDLNPLIGNSNSVTVADSRIKLGKC